MALNQRKSNKGDSLEWQGPTMSTAEANPVNPSDEIFLGKALPIIPPQEVTGRRDFTIPTKPTLHYRDGLDGAAETVTVKERRFFAVPSQAAGEAETPLYKTGADNDHGEFGEAPGQDPNKYSRGENGAYTTNGQLIRGT